MGKVVAAVGVGVGVNSAEKNSLSIRTEAVRKAISDGVDLNDYKTIKKYIEHAMAVSSSRSTDAMRRALIWIALVAVTIITGAALAAPPSVQVVTAFVEFWPAAPPGDPDRHYFVQLDTDPVSGQHRILIGFESGGPEGFRTVYHSGAIPSGAVRVRNGEVTLSLSASAAANLRSVYGDGHDAGCLGAPGGVSIRWYMDGGVARAEGTIDVPSPLPIPADHFASYSIE